MATPREAQAMHLRKIITRITEITERCYKGNHEFEKIFESGNEMESRVVRWCKRCGSVVVDIDFDGRTHPGAVMKMKSPAISSSR